nr:MAG TPA: hypothetical protein [Caudoviricetes sp.]
MSEVVNFVAITHHGGDLAVMVKRDAGAATPARQLNITTNRLSIGDSR